MTNIDNGVKIYALFDNKKVEIGEICRNGANVWKIANILELQTLEFDKKIQITDLSMHCTLKNVETCFYVHYSLTNLSNYEENSIEFDKKLEFTKRIVELYNKYNEELT